MGHQNAHHIRKQRDMALPSGRQPEQFFTQPFNYGGIDCLIPINELLEQSGEGVERMRYVDVEFEPLVEEAYAAIGSPDITLESAWVVFQQMIAHLESGLQMDSL